MTLRILTTTAALGVCALALAACDNGQSSRKMWARLRAEQAAANPPELWSAQVLPASDAAPAVTVCADLAMKTGFRNMTPTIGAGPCTRAGNAVATAAGSTFQCAVGQTVYTVDVITTGDLNSDFTTIQTIKPTAGGAPFTQTIQFQRKGPCPAGWQVGDTTNRKGEKVSGLTR